MQQPTILGWKESKCEVSVMYEQTERETDRSFMVEWTYLPIVGVLTMGWCKEVIFVCGLMAGMQNFIPMICSTDCTWMALNREGSHWEFYPDM